MSSTGQIAGGIVGAVVGYFASGGNPVGALQSASLPGGFVDLSTTDQVDEQKQEVETHEHP